jgi:hypothetical protein
MWLMRSLYRDQLKQTEITQTIPDSVEPQPVPVTDENETENAMTEIVSDSSPEPVENIQLKLTKVTEIPEKFLSTVPHFPLIVS